MVTAACEHTAHFTGTLLCPVPEVTMAGAPAVTHGMCAHRVTQQHRHVHTGMCMYLHAQSHTGSCTQQHRHVHTYTRVHTGMHTGSHMQMHRGTHV